MCVYIYIYIYIHVCYVYYVCILAYVYHPMSTSMIPAARRLQPQQP